MPEQHQTRLAEILTEAMKVKEVSIRDLALATGVTYEHIRRVVRGMNNPATPLLKLICASLQLNETDLMQYAAADELERKYGDVPAILSGKAPDMVMLERYWAHLTPDQKQDLTNLAQQWATRNREKV
jgi:transcriptional regulator with XRE-family HTH domain